MLLPSGHLYSSNDQPQSGLCKERSRRATSRLPLVGSTYRDVVSSIESSRRCVRRNLPAKYTTQWTSRTGPDYGPPRPAISPVLRRFRSSRLCSHRIQTPLMHLIDQLPFALRLFRPPHLFDFPVFYRSPWSSCSFDYVVSPLRLLEYSS